jgi:catechol 2,3-dioxygenase-like lactoylglutathione lyase family enzyme
MIFFLAAALLSLALIVGMVGTAGGQGSAGGPTRIIFMHHSTGWGLIWQGGVREALTDLGYEFWDHDYNDPGLTGPDGELTGENWDVPDDNTDPNGWHDIFAQRVTDPPQNTFSHMLTFDVIIFKSCFPNADIQSEEQFEEYRGYFLDIRDVIDQHPDRLFIALTIPPLTPNSTSPEAAARLATRPSTSSPGATRLALFPKAEGTKAEHTALSFRVADIGAAIAALKARGVRFADYDLPDFKTVGHVCVLGSEKAAWFSDPEGNILCLHQDLE